MGLSSGPARISRTAGFGRHSPTPEPGRTRTVVEAWRGSYISLRAAAKGNAAQKREDCRKLQEHRFFDPVSFTSR